MNLQPNAVRAALERHGEWLRNLRWVGTAEYCLVLLALALTIGCGLAAGWRGGVAGLVTPGAHLLLLGGILTAVPRRLSSPLLGVLCISLLNYSVVLLMQTAQVRTIDQVYGALGLLAGAWGLLRLPALRRNWREIGNYGEQDDYRWLLTAAPLGLRWLVQVELSRRAAAPGDRVKTEQ